MAQRVDSCRTAPGSHASEELRHHFFPASYQSFFSLDFFLCQLGPLSSWKEKGVRPKGNNFRQTERLRWGFLSSLSCFPRTSFRVSLCTPCCCSSACFFFLALSYRSHPMFSFAEMSTRAKKSEIAGRHSVGRSFQERKTGGRISPPSHSTDASQPGDHRASRLLPSPYHRSSRGVE